MEHSGHSAIESPSSGSMGDDPESPHYSPMLMLPLLPYHFLRHDQAGPIIHDLFNIVNMEIETDQKRDFLLGKLDIINREIRKLNVDNIVDAELGIIDIDTFLFAWEEPESGPHLEEFCRLHYYPAEWAHRPPGIGGRYQPYPDKYWKSCDWNTAGMLLQFVWDLRRAQVKDEIIDCQERILLEFESGFNGSLSKLHKAHGNWGSANHFLYVEELLRDYQAMAKCLKTEDDRFYNKYRLVFRTKCALYGYPRKWVPCSYGCEKSRERHARRRLEFASVECQGHW